MRRTRTTTGTTSTGSVWRPTASHVVVVRTVLGRRPLRPACDGRAARTTGPRNSPYVRRARRRRWRTNPWRETAAGDARRQRTAAAGGGLPRKKRAHDPFAGRVDALRPSPPTATSTRHPHRRRRRHPRSPDPPARPPPYAIATTLFRAAETTGVRLTMGEEGRGGKKSHDNSDRFRARPPPPLARQCSRRASTRTTAVPTVRVPLKRVHTRRLKRSSLTILITE